MKMNMQDESSVLNGIKKTLDRIEQTLLDILNQQKKMEANIMAQLDDLNAKLDAIGTAIDNASAALAKLKTDLDKTLADLAAKIAAGGTPTDLTDALAKAQAISDKLTPIQQALADLDTETVSADQP